MSKKLIVSLVLIAFAALVMVFNNKGSISVNILFATVEGAKALVFFGWLVVGVVIGLFLNK